MKHGGGVAGGASVILAGTSSSCAFYPYTTLRVVPLPIYDGEDAVQLSSIILMIAEKSFPEPPSSAKRV